MFKKFVFVAVSMLMAANSVMANDDIASMLANLDGAKDKSAQVADADQLGQKDVDALLGEDKEDSEEAVAACFRRYGNSGHHGSYGNYGNYGCYGGYHNNWYTTSYSYSYCAPTYCYTPVTYCYTPVTYSCYTPCYTSYWGCW
jgi:hypothetical protein